MNLSSKKKKSEVCDAFRKWKATIENEIGLKVKHLKFDNGEENTDEKLKEFFVANRIKLEKNVPKIP